ncbi:MAG: hypothetical protein ACRYF4_05310 [Janthinobacterium lividum]
MDALVTRSCGVLLFGHEASLLSSRKWLLARLECQCITVSTLAKYRQETLQGDLYLVILCQTLTSDEGVSASAFAAEHLPHIPLLVMFSRHFGYEPNQHYVLLDAASGPDAFLQTTKRMLAQAPVRAGSTT